MDYDQFNTEIDFIERGKHLDELGDATSIANVNPALISRQQQLQRQIAQLQKQMDKAQADLSEVEKAIATSKAAKTEPIT